VLAALRPRLAGLRVPRRLITSRRIAACLRGSRGRDEHRER